MKTATENLTKIFEDSSTPHSKMCGTSTEKINKDVEDLNYTLNQLDLIDICRILYLTIAKCTFFSGVQAVFSTIDHKTSINRFKRIEITPSVFPNHKPTAEKDKGDHRREHRQGPGVGIAVSIEEQVAGRGGNFRV